ncbi:hypothetical protein SmJEL517_g00351 [Synchytrium microbalum]|uniref:Chitin-binding type-3 domain-containing protein n=1 Tax=Synchytrium microbalum TaxID=1806994 RepID=A0A507CFI2_9FUNG|nr:uncharacterized protein SmJEL517_g00351 [Synchytrium microbalum]TPX38118.1 hypothetical protein SmJEL517_g00351 [Synchytrium microbalum]
MLEGQSHPDPLDPASKHAPKWVQATGNNLPPDAMQGGSEGSHPLFIARASIDGGVHPGKCGPTMEPSGAHFSTLYRWERISKGITTMMELKKQGVLKPVTGGFEKDGRPLYVCQAIHEDDSGQTVHPGKCGMHMPEGAHYAYGGNERTTERFSLLMIDTSMLGTETPAPPRQSEGGYPFRPTESAFGDGPGPTEGAYGGEPPRRTEGDDGNYPPRQSEGGLREWAEGITYEPGQVYRYNGEDYTVIQGHTAHPGAGWNPAATPALWRRGGNC